MVQFTREESEWGPGQVFSSGAVDSGKCPTELRKDPEAAVGFGETSDAVAKIYTTLSIGLLICRSIHPICRSVDRSFNLSIDLLYLIISICLLLSCLVFSYLI